MNLLTTLRIILLSFLISIIIICGWVIVDAIIHKKWLICLGGFILLIHHLNNYIQIKYDKK
jgi:hypothetical protein